jgi:hypothetical protein
MAENFARPGNDDMFECLEDTLISFVTHWRSPFTGGGRGILPKGTKVKVVVAANVADPAAYYARPIGTDTLEALLVPAAERASETYDGFSLVLPITDFATKFRKIGSANAGAI